MVTINGKEYTVTRAKFKLFITLQSLQEKIEKAITPEEQADLICRYVSTSLAISEETVTNEPWKNVAVAYVAVLTENLLDLSLPFLKVKVKEQQALPWDYPGRDWYSYAHLFASEYGWTLEYIANLEVEDAMKLMQELLVSEQLRREWQWDISEKSTGYDEATKKAKHVDLPRPEWMIIVPPPPKKIKIKRSHLPAGIILRPDGSQNVELN